jgi:protease-4
LNNEQRAVLTDIITGIYDEFKAEVSVGRDLPLEAVEAVAQGRIWTGTQALETGLVDTIGGLSVAMNIARAKAGLDTAAHRVHYYPEKSSFFDALARKISWAVSFSGQGWDLSTEESRLRAAVTFLRQYYDRIDFAQVVLPVRLDN